MSISKVKVPDIGDFKNVEVIEVLCKEGQSVAVEDPLITIESDKATIDVPSPLAGRILSIKIKSGDKVSEGNLILVTHYVIIGGALGYYPSSGELVITDKSLEVLDSIKTKY